MHKIGLSGWATFNQCWQGDIQSIFLQVLAKQIGLHNANNHFFRKTKERLALTYFFEKMKNNDEKMRWAKVPEELKKKLKTPQDLIVRFSLLFAFFSCCLLSEFKMVSDCDRRKRLEG